MTGSMDTMFGRGEGMKLGSKRWDSEDREELSSGQAMKAIYMDSGVALQRY